MVRLVEVDQFAKHHIVKNERYQKKKHWCIFFCGRRIRKEVCKELADEDIGINTCTVCLTRYYNNCRCNHREEISIGTKLKVSLEVSETGWIKIVGDHTECEPNKLQPGINNWDYLAIEWDEDNGCSRGSYFEVTKEEVKKWKETYK